MLLIFFLLLVVLECDRLILLHHRICGGGKVAVDENEHEKSQAFKDISLILCESDHKWSYYSSDSEGSIGDTEP